MICSNFLEQVLVDLLVYSRVVMQRFAFRLSAVGLAGKAGKSSRQIHRKLINWTQTKVSMDLFGNT